MSNPIDKKDWSIDHDNLAFVPTDSSKNFSDANLTPLNSDSNPDVLAREAIRARGWQDVQKTYTEALQKGFTFLGNLIQQSQQIARNTPIYTRTTGSNASFLAGCTGERTVCEVQDPNDPSKTIEVDCNGDLDGDGHTNIDEADASDGTGILNDTENNTDTARPDATSSEDTQLQQDAPDALHVDPIKRDRDGDGYCSSYEGCVGEAQPGDCQDDSESNSMASSIHPGAADMVGNGIDENCDGIDGVDADEDERASIASGGDDCDDSNANIYPGTIQRFNGADTNCDGNKLIVPERDAVKFLGVEYGGEAGRAVRMGDVNGDGFDDVVMYGHYNKVPNTIDSDNGRVYIFFGGEDKFIPGATILVSQADVTLTGGYDSFRKPTDSAWALGASLEVVDVNRDGLADIQMSVGSSFEGKNGMILTMFGREEWNQAYDFHNIDIWNPNDLNTHNAASIMNFPVDPQGQGMLLNWSTSDWSPAGKEPTLLITHGMGYNSRTTADVLPLRGLTRGAQLMYADVMTHRVHSSVDSNLMLQGTIDIRDVNNDGLGDFLVGNNRDFLEDNVMLVMSAGSMVSEFHLDQLNQYPELQWLKFKCVSNIDSFGKQVRFANVDGDDKADLIFSDPGIGVAYLVPGADLVLSGPQQQSGILQSGDTINVIEDLPNYPAYRIANLSSSTSFPSAAPILAADTNGDGIDEVLFMDGMDPLYSGFLFDFSQMSPGDYSTTQSHGFLPKGFKGGLDGRSNGFGDVNGDGASEIILGQPGFVDPNNPSRIVGGAYLMFGGE
jgi:hypothetical protein